MISCDICVSVLSLNVLISTSNHVAEAAFVPTLLSSIPLYILWYGLLIQALQMLHTDLLAWMSSHGENKPIPQKKPICGLGLLERSSVPLEGLNRSNVNRLPASTVKDAPSWSLPRCFNMIISSLRSSQIPNNARQKTPWVENRRLWG